MAVFTEKGKVGREGIGIQKRKKRKLLNISWTKSIANGSAEVKRMQEDISLAIVVRKSHGKKRTVRISFHGDASTFDSLQKTLKHLVGSVIVSWEVTYMPTPVIWKKNMASASYKNSKKKNTKSSKTSLTKKK